MPTRVGRAFSVNRSLDECGKEGMGNRYLPTNVYRNTAKKPPRRIRIIAVFDNSAGVQTHKHKFMNTLQPPTPFYKTFWTYAHRSPDLKYLL